MTRATVTARADASVDSLIALMTTHHIGCVPIVDDQNRPTGIVTRLDVLECQKESRATAREIMMPHAMTLPEDAPLSRAAALMATEGIHHLLIVDASRTLRGILSTFDVTRWVAQKQT
ncbi:MAG: CBS domain-containing protein [Proteobacteria bacterium]|nr:CBS domain-containing protein [Pseudomonadota bacterium]